MPPFLEFISEFDLPRYPFKMAYKPYGSGAICYALRLTRTGDLHLLAGAEKDPRLASRKLGMLAGPESAIARNPAHITRLAAAIPD
jgi:hypothetical protein